ncbi:uncharacterized protein LOC126630289 [Malus sylvestris]|uniref:Uncharacterized protein n=1 Tax=Malus domestica TaxID=3750 RepID=A0A498JIV1_MALDO|nr:uncharacterized protein LOC126630289 [Malus sylvestris]RXH94986.1 hypothetical protein DVH24_024670 [Malus domestica]
MTCDPRPLAVSSLDPLLHSFASFRSRVANCKTTAEPLVMNLSGEALDAYNEAYEELMKISESYEEDSPCSIFETFSAQNHSQTQSEEVNGSVGNFAFSKEETAGDDSPCQAFETFRLQSPRQTQSEQVISSVGNFAFSKEETLGEKFHEEFCKRVFMWMTLK